MKQKIFFLIFLSLFRVLICQETDLPYKDDPEVVSKLEALGGNESISLGKPHVSGLSGGWEKSDYFSHGAFTRDYCAKMPYASDRRTAMYAGQGHNDPHFNDCWEYHLGSNTWHCLSMPDGGSTEKYMRSLFVKAYGRDGKGMEPDLEKREGIKKEIAEWVKENLVIRNGYVQTSKNNGPVFQWHTWDGLTYDPITKKMHWAVLGDQESNLKRYCTALDKDYETEKKQTKEALGLFSFDPITKKWNIHFRKDPMPRMRGMGGSLIYVPDQKKVYWYVSASNVSPGDFDMWSWDLEKDTWSVIKPNGGKEIRALVEQNLAPGCELQMAYSSKHRKIVAVQGEFVHTYDIDKNEWARVADDQMVYAHDAHTVFDYDSHSDVFILAQPKFQHATYGPVKYHNHEEGLFAFSLNTMKWEKLNPGGASLFVKPKWEALKGYYDPDHNVFVISARGIWAYRYSKKEASK